MNARTEAPAGKTGLFFSVEWCPGSMFVLFDGGKGRRVASLFFDKKLAVALIWIGQNLSGRSLCVWSDEKI